MLAFLGHVRDELLLVGFVSLFLSVFQVSVAPGINVAASSLQNLGTASE